MKTLTILFVIMCCILFSSAQEENSTIELKLDEVEVSPPLFTGVKTTIVEESSHLNNLRAYLNKNLVYPEEAQKCMVQGTEVVTFAISSKGKVTDIKVINSVCPEIDEEVIRVLESTNGMWNPGIRDGELVSMPQEVSMIFAFSDNIQNAAKAFQKRAKSHFIKGTKNLYVKQNFKRAEKWYNMAMNYLPYDQSIILMRGLARYENGNHEGAIEDWRRLKNMGGIDLESFYYAEDMKKMKGYEELVSLLEE